LGPKRGVGAGGESVILVEKETTSFPFVDASFGSKQKGIVEKAGKAKSNRDV